MKKEKTVSVNYNGLGVGSLLGVLFIGLKLTGHIDWSWWLVLLPFYVVPAIMLGIAVLAFSFAGIVAGGIWLSERFEK